MADSEVRQKSQRELMYIELARITENHFVNRPARLKFALEEAYAAGMRAGEIAMREKAAQALESRPYYSNQTPEAIRALPLSGAEESKTH